MADFGPSCLISPALIQKTQFCGNVSLSAANGHLNDCQGHCTANVFSVFIHVSFLVVASSVLLAAGRCTNLRNYFSKSLIKFPGHYCKWSFSIVLGVILLAALGEGVLTDVTRNSETQPQLYVPQIFAITNVIVSLVYYHHSEYWNRPRFAWLLLVYWILATVAECFRLITLLNQYTFDWKLLRFDLIIACILMYMAFVVLEINLLRSKVFGWRFHEPPYPPDLRKRYMYYNYKYTNFLSQISFWSLNWLFILGFKSPLELTDLGCLPEEFGARYQYGHFQRAYETEKSRAVKTKRQASLWRTYAHAYGREICISVSLWCLSATFGFIPALTVGGVVQYASDWQTQSNEAIESDAPMVTVDEYFRNGFILVGVIFIATVLRSFCMAFGGNISVMKSIQLKSALQTLAYEKSLHLSTASLSGGAMTTGQITNHMSVDAVSVQYLCMHTIFLSSIPYQIIVVLFLLYWQLGYAALIGSSVFLIVTPLQYAILRKMASIQRIVLRFSDQRLKRSNEVLQGIKLLKLYGWEELFCSAIETVRAEEVARMMKAGACIVVTTFLAQATPIIVTFISFAVYSVTGPSPLTPELAFASLALFNQLVYPLSILPTSMSYLVNGVASTRRLQTFYAAPEIEELDTGRKPLGRGFGSAGSDDDQDDYIDGSDEVSGDVINIANAYNFTRRDKPDDKTPVVGRDSSNYGTFENKTVSANPDEVFSVLGNDTIPDEVALQILNGNFAWETDALTPTIQDINVEILSGKLTMVVGLVGSGKSSLLSAMLQEMSTVSGSVKFKANREGNSVSYVPQKPWLQNATLKNNILFGNEFNFKRYRKVIEVCALQADIDILPGGDMTEIGEKGINLSGGQKQRVSVARALYSHSDIVLMDDPLSALDVHVGSHLMERGIMNFLLKEGRTVVLVTHQVQYLQNADKVIIMENGRISDQGNPSDIGSRDPDLISAFEEKIRSISESELDSESDMERSVELERRDLRRRISEKEITDKRTASGAGASLIEAEERERGSVSWKIYYTYAKAIKIPLVCLIFVFFLGQGTAHILTNFWLAEWSEAGGGADNTNATQEEDTNFYLSVYGVLSMTYVILALATTTCQIIFSLLAAKRIHIALLRNIVHAPVRFFDTTPIGRILNRFSNDTQLIDQRLWLSINTIMTSSLQFVSALVVNMIVTPVFIVAVFPVLVCYFVVMKYFITTSRELKRLDSISISPVFAHLSETLGGLTTIRAYRSDNRFKQRFIHRLDQNNLAQLYLHTSNRWLGIRLECIGAVIILISCLSSLLSSVLGDLEPSRVGLSITYALSICAFLTNLVRSMADCEIQMNAVERVDFYTHVDSEEYQGIYNPPSDWPDEGRIEFNGVSARYSRELDPVLENVTIEFAGGEKIGICGRTGSGKSSLTLSVFRMIDTYKGYIFIDGINICDVPLLSLRSRLSIIPQDPVLFAGTIRFNLDPEGLRDDDELWHALDIAQLKHTVSELENQLDAEITDEGDNFSVGQRQLFCLARAFLRKARVLIMDEATASVDMKTDAILRNVIKTAFVDRTVLIIAHRITSIIDSDKVLVLSNGQVMEYDTPDNLLHTEDSLFHSLVNKSSNA